MAKRLASLDALRGFDLFCLTALCPIIHAFERTGCCPGLQPLYDQFEHVPWEGFHAWDLVMPLFMFMAGVSIPFAFAKYREENRSKGKIYWRIVKRVLLLWILGMICQGNLLDLKFADLKFFSNTLQSIAVGYLVASLFFLNTKPKTQMICAVGMLVLYWALMTFVKIDGCGGGDYSPTGNLATYLDHRILGTHSDACHIHSDGSISWSTCNSVWLLPSINFAVTVMSGMFAGELLKSERAEKRKLAVLFGGGAAMVALGWLWNLEMPVNKALWTSSMVLVSSGWCFLLLGLFYFLVDYKQWGRGFGWLNVYGMNSILAYLLGMEVNLIPMKSISKSLLYGLEQFMPAVWYKFIIVVATALLLYLILKLLYKHKIFVRV